MGLVRTGLAAVAASLARSAASSPYLLAVGLLACGSSSSDVAKSTDGGIGGQPAGPDGASGQDGASPASADSGSPDGETSATDGATTLGEGGAATGATIGSFVGVNALITDSVANLAPIGVVREYHNWGWLGNNYNDQPYPQTLYTPNIPSFGWNWDAFFMGLQSMGVSGFPAVQGPAPWVNSSAVPPASGSPTAAASYIAHGDTMFQIAARWGSTHVATSLLKLEPGQTVSSGLGTVQYFEDFNEEDNATGFTGDVYAAMASADYDGDQMRLGATIGVKNADPSAMLVMGGLSGAYGSGTTWIDSITKFLDAARAWSTTN